MRVLLFSKAATRAIYHQQYEHIADQPGIDELLVVVPPYWCEPRVGILHLEEVLPTRYRLEVTPLRWNGHYHIYYAPLLPRLLREFRPDILHVDEEVYNFATWHAVFAARRVGATCTAFCWQNIYRRYPPPFCWFERMLAQRLHGVIVGNVDAMTVLRRKGFRLHIEVIPQYGVDVEHFTPAPSPSIPPFRIGFVGRLVPAKGIGVLLQALHRLPIQCEVWIAGEGDPAPWRALSEQLAVAARVHWVGAIPSREVASFLQQLHVLVLPSLTTPRWKEQFGRVLVEAMACGVPVVGSDSGEIPRVIGEAGMVFREGDPLDLARCLRVLLDSPEERITRAHAARQRAVQQFSMSKVASEYVEFWKSLY